MDDSQGPYYRHATTNQTLTRHPSSWGQKGRRCLAAVEAPPSPHRTAGTTFLNYTLYSHELGHWSFLGTPEKQ